MDDIYSKIAEKHDLSFLDKLNNDEIGVFAFGGLIRDIYLERDWDDVDLRIVYNKPREEREKITEEALEEYGLEGKTVIEDLNLTVYRFLPEKSPLRESIDLSLVPTINDNLPDFTINSLFFDLKTREIVDTYDGISDLKRGVIRTVKPANQHFVEEPHMMFRAIKFSCQIGFEIEADTLKAILANKGEVQNTFEFIKETKEGIFVELFLGNIFKGMRSNPLKYFEYLSKTGLYEEMLIFAEKNLDSKHRENSKIKPQDLGSYESNISYLFSSILNNLKIENKEEGLKTLLDIFAMSTVKKYSDFVIKVDEVKYF